LTATILLGGTNLGDEEMSNWTVWVGGSEMDTHLVSLDQAQLIADEWRRRGYDDVVIEEVE